MSTSSAVKPDLSRSSRTLILGVGNTVRGDDGAGIHTVRGLDPSCLPDGCVIDELGTAGLELLDVVAGFDRLILVDAIDCGAEPGTVLEFAQEDLASVAPLHCVSTHDVGVLHALDLASRLGLASPMAVRIVAIQVADATVFSERCTESVEAALPRARRLIERLAVTLW
jgi:hydrogenase maturation protease